MAKGLRSNVKKALRTVRRSSVKANPVTEKRDAERFAKIQQTVEAGREAREIAEQARQAERLGEAPMELDKARTEQNDAAEMMDIDTKSSRLIGGPLTKKKKMKIQGKKKRSDGINQFHKKKSKRATKSRRRNKT